MNLFDDLEDKQKDKEETPKLQQGASHGEMYNACKKAFEEIPEELKKAVEEKNNDDSKIYKLESDNTTLTPIHVNEEPEDICYEVRRKSHNLILPKKKTGERICYDQIALGNNDCEKILAATGLNQRSCARAVSDLKKKGFIYACGERMGSCKKPISVYRIIF